MPFTAKVATFKTSSACVDRCLHRHICIYHPYFMCSYVFFRLFLQTLPRTTLDRLLEKGKAVDIHQRSQSAKALKFAGSLLVLVGAAMPAVVPVLSSATPATPASPMAASPPPSPIPVVISAKTLGVVPGLWRLRIVHLHQGVILKLTLSWAPQAAAHRSAGHMLRLADLM